MIARSARFLKRQRLTFFRPCYDKIIYTEEVSSHEQDCDCNSQRPRCHRSLLPGLDGGRSDFTSGQIPVDPATGAIAEGITAQAEQSCKNVGAIPAAAGVGFENVVKTTCFLADMGDFAAFNEAYAKFFHLQARPQLRGREGAAQGRFCARWRPSPSVNTHEKDRRMAVFFHALSLAQENNT